MQNFKSNVLVVESNRFLVNVLRDTLSSEFNIITAANGFEAMALLERGHKIDFIITDLKLPKFNGLELIQLLRNNQVYQKMPILALSDSGDSNARIASLENGADDCMEKPFSPFEVQAKIKAMLRRVAVKKNRLDLKKTRAIEGLRSNFPRLDSFNLN